MTDKQEIETTSADPEAAAWADMAKEYGDGTPEPVEDAKEQPETQAEPEAPKAEEPKPEDKPKLSYEDLERHTKNLNGALAEARAETRAMKERFGQFERVLAAMKQQQAPVEDDPYEDPVAKQVRTLEQQNRELSERHQEWEERSRAEAAAKQLSETVTFHEQQFAAQTPDYFDAANHLLQTRLAEMEILYPDDDPTVIQAARRDGFQHPALWRNDLIRREAMGIAADALRSGKNPAQVYYNLAKHRGYSGKPAAPAPSAPVAPPATEAAKPKRMDAIKAGMDAPGSLSTGASKSASDAEGFPSLEELADMYISEPAKAEKLFEKMSKAGLLG